MNTTHASCVALGRLGLLIRGKPGAGKSSLCLSLIDGPGQGVGDTPLRAQLVADDQVVLTRQGDALSASPPAALAGKLELRGLGIIDVPFQNSVQIGLVVDLLPLEDIARLPTPENLKAELLGISLPCMKLAIGEPAAAAKLRIALRHFGLLQRASFLT